MYVYIYIYLYIFISISISIYIYIERERYIYTYTYIHIYTNIYTHCTFIYITSMGKLVHIIVEMTVPSQNLQARFIGLLL